MDRLDRDRLMQAPPERVRALADRRKRIAAQRWASPVVGRTDPRVSATDERVEVEGRQLAVRVYRPLVYDPSAPGPLVLNFPGGGFVSGDPRQSEWWTSTIAAETGAVVVSLDYRKAPEHPYPAAVEDCYDTTLWAIEQAGRWGVDPARLAVMGDSAGGNLAAVVALAARDRGGPEIGLQVLTYPAVEAVEEFPSEYENAHALVLTKADIDGATELYFHGLDRARRMEPYASPLRADLRGVASALIQTSQQDPLRDQGSAYADALRDRGVPVRLTNYVDSAHGFVSLPGLFPCARQAAAEASAELRRALAPR